MQTVVVSCHIFSHMPTSLLVIPLNHYLWCVGKVWCLLHCSNDSGIARNWLSFEILNLPCNIRLHYAATFHFSTPFFRDFIFLLRICNKAKSSHFFTSFQHGRHSLNGYIGHWSGFCHGDQNCHFCCFQQNIEDRASLAQVSYHFSFCAPRYL